MAWTLQWGMVGGLLLALGCATAPQPKEASEEPERVGVVSGGSPFTSARCPSSGRCTCRPLNQPFGQSETNLPSPPGRRFEIRIHNFDTPTSLRVTYLDFPGRQPLEIQTGAIPGEQCYYLDLIPGKYQFDLRTAEMVQGGGVVSGLEIYEYHHGGPFWYRTLRHVCGDTRGARCSKVEIRQWSDELKLNRTRFQDPCGSGRIEGLKWDGVSAGRKYQDLLVSFDLVVNEKPPMAPPCGER